MSPILTTDWRSVLEWKPDLHERACSVDRVRAIAFVPMDRRLRNELITRTYRDQATEMATLVGADATWTTFGQWASHTIGSFLTLPVPALGRVIAHSFGYGNREVFADIGAAQALFLEIVGEAARSSAGARPEPGLVNDAFSRFEQRLGRSLLVPPGEAGVAAPSFWETVTSHDPRAAGEPPNRLLRLGFRAYADAMLVEDDPELRSRYLLLGNCLLALHEQRVLSLAISMGFRSWLRNLTQFWYLAGTQRAWRNKRPGRWRLGLENRWIAFATRHFVKVDLPWGSVPVGEPVPAGQRPIVLSGARLDRRSARDRRSLAVEALDPEEFLHELFSEFNVDGRPAQCWNDLSSRMAYIIALFAQHQRSPDWWQQAEGSSKTLVATPEWSRFDSKLSAQVARINRARSAGARRAIPVPQVAAGFDEALLDATLDLAGLDDASLDELRQQPSYPRLSAGNKVDFRRAATASSDEELPTELNLVAEDVADRLKVLRQPGGLLDRQTVAAARRVFARNETMVYTALFLRSLPDAYAAGRGVEVIGEVSELATDPMRRASETAQFIADLLARADAIDDEREAFRSVVGVRYMHSIVAWHLEDAKWDHALYGVPINQEDVLATALSFSVPVFELFDAVHLEVPEEDRDAYVRFWLGIGHLLGAPLTGIATYPEARALALRIRHRQRARTLNGVRLTEALLAGVGDGFTRGTSWMAAGLMHVVGDPAVVDLLLVGQGPGRRRSQWMAATLRFGFGHRFSRRFTRAVINRAGKKSLQPFFALGASRPFRRPLNAEEQARQGTARPVTVVDRACWPSGCGSR